MKLSILAAAFAPFAVLASDNVILTDANFDKEVIQDTKNAWFVKFYAPWCGHCKAITGVWEEFATSMHGKMKVGECDVTKNEKSASTYGVQMLPTIKLFPKGEKSAAKAVAHEGGRDLEGFTDFAEKYIGAGKKKKAEKVKPELRGSGELVELTDKNFDEKVMKDEKGIWFVKFFAPWCGHCKAMTQTWIDYAKAMKNQINVAEVDVTKESATASRFGATSLPTIKIFPAGKKKPSAAVAYEGARDINGFNEFAAKYIDGVEEQEDQVIELTDDNFDRKVYRDEKNIWFVKFYAPWCGHCKAMAGDWEKLAKTVQGKAKIGKIDATVHSSIANSFGVQSYPTLKLFPSGKKDASSAVAYEAGRDYATLQKYLQGLFDKADKVKKAGEGTGSEVVVLTDKNFDEKVMKDKDNLWAIKFYAPWCGHCKKVAPIWEELALDMRDYADVDVKVGKVDVTVEKELGERFDVKGYPQFRFFPAGKKFDNKAEKFDGVRQLSNFKAKIDELGADGGDVHILSDSTFDKKVMADKKPWMLKLYAPWCSHCQAIAPIWDELAKELKGKVNFGKIDVTINNDMALKWSVSILPTIKYLIEGEKTVENSITYGGQREKDAMKQFALNKGKVEAAKTEDGDAKAASDDDVDALMKDNSKPAFVKFYAPWCGHCKNMAPAWDELAKDVKDKVNVVKVDATAHTKWSTTFSVQSFPTLIYLPKKNKSKDSSITYDGARDVASFKAKLDEWANKAEL